MFIDGTHAQLRMKWEVIPITVIDSSRNIQCAAIAFAAYFIAEVVQWLITTIWALDPRVAEKWRTLVTDEDTAFALALEAWKTHF
jgi:hypothetical protein